MSSDPEDNAVVRIPKDLYEEIEKGLRDKGFSTVDDFVTYVLRVTLGKPSETLSEEDTKSVTDRLKRLGYV